MKASIEEESWRVETQENIKTKKKKKKKRKVKEDRLSNLPDEIILHILSFSDAKTAVQTSVLSKRWRSLWTSLPVVNFLDSSFDDPVLFQCFVQHVLSRRDASTNLNMLKLVFDDLLDVLDDVDIVDSIIDYIKPTDIQDLSITTKCFIWNLPQLSACRSLTTLHLAGIVTNSAMFDSVSLQHLYLFQCEFEYLVHENDPFSGCPNLRCLSLLDCSYVGNIHKFQIHAPQLTDLTISNMRKESGFAIELFTPKIQSFRYSDNYYLCDFFIKGNLSFVERVNIDLGGFRPNEEFTKATNLSLKLSKLFEAMGSAKFVSLSPRIIHVLSVVHPPLRCGRSSPFTSLKNFELITDTHIPLAIPTNVMAYLFGGSPGFD
ncbi:putative FBD-associated F-box protein At5g22720 [Gastrolobium bilobum]|uniref:putative FBD-associated F-box protein At5g22720 n=1 Tax=Gastrolobium bilobum TaxID=150636 RepID=UPI002AB0301F|nr:putative FBD-associated F-box protein At5g22720 [Gastrolobium bilobum]